MDRRVAPVVLAGFALAVLLASVATAGEVRLWHAPPPDDTPAAVIPLESIPIVTTQPLVPYSSDDQIELPHWIGGAVRLIALVFAVCLAALALLAVWRRRPRLHWRGEPSVGSMDVFPHIARSMRADADEQRAALGRGTPRNAIVECWLRLDAVVAGAGMPRRPADTSTEFTSRVLGAFAVDRSAIIELAALYREARFSTHAMGEAERSRAIAALDAVHDGLDARLSSSAAVGG